METVRSINSARAALGDIRQMTDSKFQKAQRRFRSERVLDSIRRIRKGASAIALWTINHLGTWAVMLAFSICVCVPDYANTVLFVTPSGSNSNVDSQLRLAAGFYGLDIRTLLVPNDSATLIGSMRRSDVSAVVLTDDSLKELDRKRVLDALHHPKSGDVPVAIILGSNDASSQLLAEWSGSAVTGCVAPADQMTVNQLSFSAYNSDKRFVHELAGGNLAVALRMSCSPVIRHSNSVSTLIDAYLGDIKVPIMIAHSNAGRLIFAIADTVASPTAHRSQGSLSNDVLSSLPIMMFIRFAAGDRAWHTPGHFANLTIDDAWLTEPYGNLKYNNLVTEMKSHHFHTTIAFIPWNYDRSEPSVVSLFRHHPDLLSICIHGNNHDHREFGDFKHSPLTQQKVNLVQALARMEEFSRRTGIPYAPVMVFPHAVSPSETFRAMKADNYWATTNSESIPLDSRAPEDPQFSLRPETLAFSDFLSIRRYSAEFPVSPSMIALQSFLGNPLLFYVHQEFFFGNIGAFDKVADSVNRIAPATEWTDLGEIVQSMYLVRKRDDGDFDVRTYSPHFKLTNEGHQKLTFHVSKTEDNSPPVSALKIDSTPATYKLAGREMSFDVAVGPGEVRRVEITYGDLQLSQVDIRKKGLWIGALRRLSDFRDQYLTTSETGMKAAAFYYSHNLDTVELAAERWGIAFIAVFGIGLVFLWRVVSSRRSALRRTGSIMDLRHPDAR